MSLSGIALVTPSFNQGRFLDATLRSVLDQGYPALEYVVLDGGSTDGSVQIIQQHASRLTAWRSQPDGGQYDAINQGFAMTSGEIMGWLNSDDLHCPWTLSVVGRIFAEFSDVRWLTTRFPMRFNGDGQVTNCTDARGFSTDALARGEYLPGSPGFLAGTIQQESTFWRRSLWEQVGGALDTSLDSAADFELWCRFSQQTDLVAVSAPLAGFRRHGDQKTSRAMEAYRAQAATAFSRHFKNSPTSAVWRNFCRDRLPTAWRPLAASLGGLFPARTLIHDPAEDRWSLQEVWV
jgi:hypothetical protein